MIYRPLLTIATASIFLHRFYMLQSLAKYKAREVALACLFLAGKVEESLRKVETVVNYCLRLEDRRRGKEPDVHPSSEVRNILQTLCSSSYSSFVRESFFSRRGRETSPKLDEYFGTLADWYTRSFVHLCSDRPSRD